MLYARPFRDEDGRVVSSQKDDRLNWTRSYSTTLKATRMMIRKYQHLQPGKLRCKVSLEGSCLRSFALIFNGRRVGEENLAGTNTYTQIVTRHLTGEDLAAYVRQELPYRPPLKNPASIIILLLILVLGEIGQRTLEKIN